VYSVKEIFYTLQGEGHNAGRPAVFCRFSGCNLWSGMESDRERAICKFCDTDFVGTDGTNGGKYSADELATMLDRTWAVADGAKKFVVFTGGEPLLQLDDALISNVHGAGFEIAVETNGTLTAPVGIDWLCVSPKAGAPLKQASGNELKLVYPQAGVSPTDFEHLKFEHFFLQPLDDDAKSENTTAAMTFCMSHPRWRLSVQLHKVLGIP
jgi:7-carboxy-7-deazaguanine synthase